jgi:hypothetical protein
LPLDEVTRRLHPSGSTYAGIRAIPIAQIVGTENRHADFDRNFRLFGFERGRAAGSVSVALP